jgi:hypothetical protein
MPSTLQEVEIVAGAYEIGNPFHLSDSLWARIVLEFSGAYKAHPLLRGQLLGSLTPLYLGRVASFVHETRLMTSREVEDRIESLCVTFESLKPYLARLWRGQGESKDMHLEVKNV